MFQCKSKAFSACFAGVVLYYAWRKEVVMQTEHWADDEHAEGYRDGRDLDAPWPSTNRSAEYRHSFEVGRAEKLGSPIPAAGSRQRVEALEAARNT